MATVFDVAQAVLARTGTISTWKLQKLVYYCQAWHCVWADKPLFTARIEAWANGPVCPDLYIRHRGEFQIDQIAGGGVMQLQHDEQRTVETVVDFYNKYNGQQLSDLTHMERPWMDARKGLSPSERGNSEITTEALAEYYGGLSNGEAQ
jgi:uncharacterized phage-associated protein